MKRRCDENEDRPKSYLYACWGHQLLMLTAIDRRPRTREQPHAKSSMSLMQTRADPIPRLCMASHLFLLTRPIDEELHPSWTSVSTGRHLDSGKHGHFFERLVSHQLLPVNAMSSRNSYSCASAFSAMVAWQGISPCCAATSVQRAGQRKPAPVISWGEASACKPSSEQLQTLQQCAITGEFSGS